MTDEEIETLRAANGYLAARRLADGSVALLQNLVFTRAICLGATQTDAFTTRRFCYEDRELANKVFAGLQSKDDIPDGWIASRGLPIP